MAVIVVIFLTTNITSAILIHHQKLYHHSLPLFILVIRVSINGALFLLAAIALSACIYKMRTTSSSNMILEAKVNVWHDLGLKYIYCIRLCQYTFLLKMISLTKSFIMELLISKILAKVKVRVYLFGGSLYWLSIFSFLSFLLSFLQLGNNL